jgi:hypothetical protein
MNEETLEAVVERMDRLERGLRRWRILESTAWTILTVGVILNLFLVFRAVSLIEEPEEEPDEAAQVEEEVRAKSFVLVDEDGRPRAALGFRADGTPALAFSDREGKLLWKAP